MDEYTQQTKAWLDERFKRCDEQGIYLAHQPIYGFRKGRSERGVLGRYIRTYQIMKALSRLSFDSFLDVGAAEGYTSGIVKTLFGTRAKNTDLSEEACKRAEEIFGTASIPAKIDDLPFPNGEFDVVLCSETLEHVNDVDRAIDEIVRVAGKALVITVPHEPEETVAANVRERKSHGHIHRFNLQSFDFLKSRGYRVIASPVHSPLLALPGAAVEAMPRDYHSKSKYPRAAVSVYNAAVPLLQKLFGKQAVASLIRLDEIACRLAPAHNGLVFTVLKDESCYLAETIPRIQASDILDFEVPYHYLASVK